MLENALFPGIKIRKQKKRNYWVVKKVEKIEKEKNEQIDYKCKEYVNPSSKPIK